MNKPINSVNSPQGIRRLPVLRGARTAAVLFLATLVVACGGGSGDHLQEPVPVVFERMQEEFSGTYARGEYVLRTQSELEAAWRLAPQQFGQSMPIPVVDFTRYSIVGISLGVGMRCDVPLVTRVASKGDALLVHYKTNEGTGVTSLGCVHQWRLSDFVRVPAFSGAVTFERVRE